MKFCDSIVFDNHMVSKTLVIGITIENPEVTKVDHAESAPSLFDFDIVIADIDAVLPVWCQNKCPENEYMETEDDYFYKFEKLSERLRKELSFLLKKGARFLFTNAEDKRHEHRVKAEQLIENGINADTKKYLLLLYASAASLLSVSGYTAKSVYDAIRGYCRKRITEY